MSTLNQQVYFLHLEEQFFIDIIYLIVSSAFLYAALPMLSLSISSLMYQKSSQFLQVCYLKNLLCIDAVIFITVLFFML